MVISRHQLLVLSLATCVFVVTVISGTSNFIILALTAIPPGVGFSLLQPTPFVIILDTARARCWSNSFGWSFRHRFYCQRFYVIAGIIGIFTFISWMIFYQTKRKVTTSH